MPYSVKGFFEINEDMVQILLMLEVLFTQNSKVEDLFCGASSGSEPSLFFSNYFFSLGFQPIQDDFQHDFARLCLVRIFLYARTSRKVRVMQTEKSSYDESSKTYRSIKSSCGNWTNRSVRGGDHEVMIHRCETI